jgi:type I restriction enzyme, R subunit
VLELLADHTELFKQFSDNPNFKRWLTDTVFDVTYQPGVADAQTQLSRLKTRALTTVRSSFGNAPVWNVAVDALFARLAESDQCRLGLADLASIEMAQNLSVTNLLFPVLNLLSASDVGILRREFVRTDAALDDSALSFDDVRQVALVATESSVDDWADQVSIRWVANDTLPPDRGGLHVV